ncbi:mitochondrial fission regulator 2 [Electrophorus electricus]|uniref:Mitochondrial fission regulator n=1 Tax=Electrophorus electricus TaxID=8005 RepID=A0A4W4EEW9_ELEEL|nr:mitochondrial fission regulator 2 [Electrophorus electricus]XP_035378388.1 mitochondrial fission regulator 2 [Electrophorus electricus]XP_035378389.1 mitochondrial fission regulator 2 [Electrophorus electricus]
MSLLEDLVYLLRYVVEYFGVPADMLVPVWDTTLCGQYRSIVRMIGTNLPLAPYPRIHFQIPLQTSRRQEHVDESVNGRAIPSLEDVLWLAEEEGDRSTKFRGNVPLRNARWLRGTEAARPACGAPRAQQGHVAQGLNMQPEALQKISALEAELLRLQAQIAMIVAIPTVDSPGLGEPATPCFHPAPAPAFTSTPLSVPPPPPAPPLPPPPPPLAGFVQSSVSEVIRQRQAARRGKAELREPSDDPAATPLPSMLEVLKDLNQVKLRTVERSPGGTPMRKRRSKGLACSLDPAALIAEALKRKFAHRQRNNSFDKENRSAEPSPFSSPDTPRVIHLTRRSQGRVHL